MQRTKLSIHERGERMTRLEAISELSEMKTDAWTDERQMKALTMAIQSMKAIEDIKAEIEQMNNIDYVAPVTVDEVLQIIDKHIGRG